MSAIVRAFRGLGKTRLLPACRSVVIFADRVLYRRTHGRVTLVGLAGLPSIILTVQGRRSGLPRVAPVLCIRDGANFVVVASNWGQARHPEWSTNLLVSGEAVVNHRGREFPVAARFLSGAERERYWQSAIEAWPGYVEYSRRSGRELRMFLLSPVSEVAAPRAS